VVLVVAHVEVFAVFSQHLKCSLIDSCSGTVLLGRSLI
jgi:hypothetical protein